jgi:hypothetical protein
MAGRRPSSDYEVKPPSGLRAPGRKLWNAVVVPYVLTPGELANLAEACRTADECDRLEKAVRALPELTTTGSTGQVKAHPLLEEARRHLLLLALDEDVASWDDNAAHLEGFRCLLD